VDLAKKRRGGSSWKRPSYYVVERTVVFSECTLPVCAVAYFTYLRTGTGVRTVVRLGRKESTENNL
jgi:hypothetical protein